MTRHIHRFALFTLTLLASRAAWSANLPGTGNMTPAVALAGLTTIQPLNPTCAPFLEPFDIDDYSGPMGNLVGRVSHRVETSTVRAPHPHAGLPPCAMTSGDKLRLWVNDTTDPLNLVGVGFSAALAQAFWDDPAYKQGAAGYGKRYSAALADNATSDFFETFFYPSLFRQDPRYYRLGQGTAKHRTLHALAHRFVAQSDTGRPMFNYSEWMGTASSLAIGNLYHPGNPRGFGPTAGRVGFSIGNDMAWDVLREFWPEVAHKFKLPFRTRQ